MTRCRVGDLAVIVRARDREYEENLGRLVRVRRPYGGELLPGHFVAYESAGGWVVESEGRPLRASNHYLFYSHLHVCSDSALRPIRNPGDDAKDESLSWLPPVPNDISAEDPQDLREALKQWAEEQR